MSEAASTDSTPREIDYGGTPYQSYFEADGYGLNAHVGEGDRQEWSRDDIGPKTVVCGVQIGSDVLGFPLPTVRDSGGVVEASVGGRDIVVFATDEDGIHGYVDPGFDFDNDDSEVRGDGTNWNPVTGRSADGRQLHRLPTRRLFAFAWQDDHGPESFYER